MSNIALPSLICDETVALRFVEFDASATVETGLHNLTVQMTGYTAGIWQVSIGGPDNFSSVFAEDGTTTVQVDVTEVTNNKIRILGRSNPGGQLSIVSIERDDTPGVNIGMPTLVCDESEPLAYVEFDAAETIETGVHDLTVQVSGWTAGSWMVFVAGLTPSTPFDGDGTYTVPLDVESIANNKIRILARSQPGGQLSIVELVREDAVS